MYIHGWIDIYLYRQRERYVFVLFALYFSIVLLYQSHEINNCRDINYFLQIFYFCLDLILHFCQHAMFTCKNLLFRLLIASRVIWTLQKMTNLTKYFLGVTAMIGIDIKVFFFISKESCTFSVQILTTVFISLQRLMRGIFKLCFFPLLLN